MQGKVLSQADVRRKIHVQPCRQQQPRDQQFPDVRIRRQCEDWNRERPHQLRRTGRGPDRQGYEVLRHPKYEVYLDVGGKLRFRLKASNGDIIAVSQAYADKPSCMKGIASIGSHAPDAKIVIEESE